MSGNKNMMRVVLKWAGVRGHTKLKEAEACVREVAAQEIGELKTNGQNSAFARGHDLGISRAQNKVRRIKC